MSHFPIEFEIDHRKVDKLVLIIVESTYSMCWTMKNIDFSFLPISYMIDLCLVSPSLHYDKC